MKKYPCKLDCGIESFEHTHPEGYRKNVLPTERQIQNEMRETELGGEMFMEIQAKKNTEYHAEARRKREEKNKRILSELGGDNVRPNLSKPDDRIAAAGMTEEPEECECHCHMPKPHINDGKCERYGYPCEHCKPPEAPKKVKRFIEEKCMFCESRIEHTPCFKINLYFDSLASEIELLHAENEKLRGRVEALERNQKTNNYV